MSDVLRHLPLLEPHRDALEKCVYCPKLCRASCPVSNAEPNESLIPWGKMSTAYFIGRGDIAPTAANASVAWACTDCFSCRERCDHKNLVGRTLLDARAELFTRGAAPPGAVALADGWLARAEARREAVDAIGGEPAAGARTRLLLGCSYLRRSPEVAKTALRVVRHLVGEPVSVAHGCCGYPLRAAGDDAGFRREREALKNEVGNARLVVLDPGCFRSVSEGADGTDAAPTLLVDSALSSLDRFQKRDGLDAPRFHDPCQLGRGLGKYDAPRALIERIVGAPPKEFERARERADCAGSGGLLPLTRPENSSKIADDRLGEHARLGGGALVTACGSSLHRFRKNGADPKDLVHYLAMGLGLD